MNKPSDQIESRERFGQAAMLSEKILRALRGALKRARRKDENLKSDLAAGAEADALRRQAELLKAALPALKRGQKEATVRDFFAPGGDGVVTIPLDPARPPRETVQKLFKQAAKFERGREQIAAQIAENLGHIQTLEKLFAELEQSLADKPGVELPPEFLRRSAGAGIKEASELAAKQAASATGADKPRPLSKREQEQARLLRSVRVFRSRDGAEILVGKSNTDNDTLSFRLARGNDWWFHLAPAPGSHVLARHDQNVSGGISQETLLDAATLAVHFSKMRGAPKADVHYTQARHVRRIKGAPPGKVAIESFETVLVRVEKERLERLLKGGDKL